MFTGFPAEAIAFYEGLVADNSKTYWTANKDVYERCVLEPMEAMLDELSGEFGRWKIFRPYRDVRFSKDKSPYKTACGATLGEGAASVNYVQLSADGLMVAAGLHMPQPDVLARYRDAVAEDRSGKQLTRIVADLKKKRYGIWGEQLKTAPRGYPPDHPRIDLLRYKGIHTGTDWPPGTWLSTRKALDRVAEAFRTAAPLNDWMRKHVS